MSTTAVSRKDLPKTNPADADTTAIRPFHVTVPETELNDLSRRINATRWPEKETVTDASQGLRRSARGSDRCAGVSWGSRQAEHSTELLGV
jgi:hypothetical protein